MLLRIIFELRRAAVISGCRFLHWTAFIDSPYENKQEVQLSVTSKTQGYKQIHLFIFFFCLYLRRDESMEMSIFGSTKVSSVRKKTFSCLVILIFWCVSMRSKVSFVNNHIYFGPRRVEEYRRSWRPIQVSLVY